MRTEERKAGEVLAGKYTVVRTLGEGSSGVTYEAKTIDGTRVAIKELSLGRLKSWKQFELFEREAAMLKSLSHPSIPQYVDYVEASGCFFLVQELAEGATLAKVVTDVTERFDEAEVKRIARSLLEIVNYLSSRRPPVVHRDIKPENIVLEGARIGGRVLLVDFGGVQDAMNVDANVLGSTIVGTAGYMAPETLRGTSTPASDMYSLGAVLLFLLSGRRPQQFRSERLKLQFDDVVMGPRMRALLHGLLDPIPEDRLTPHQALDILDGKSDGLQQTGGGWLGRRPRVAAEPRQGSYLEPQGYAGPGVYQQGFRDMGYGVEGLPRLARPWRQAPSKPAGSRVIVETVDDLLMIDVPPDGVSGGTVGTGAFALVWNVLIGTWTVSALMGGGLVMALFSIPFWFAGGSLVRQTVLAALLRESIQINARMWNLSQELAKLSGGVARFVGGGLVTAEGMTRDLDGCRVVTTMVVNGEPRTCIELVEGRNTYRIGEGLSISEQQWLVGEINRHIEAVSGAVVGVENDLVPASDVPVVNDYNNPGDRRRRRFMDDD